MQKRISWTFKSIDIRFIRHKDNLRRGYWSIPRTRDLFKIPGYRIIGPFQFGPAPLSTGSFYRFEIPVIYVTKQAKSPTLFLSSPSSLRQLLSTPSFSAILERILVAAMRLL